jgi:signal transduction histidine kinase
MSGARDDAILQELSITTVANEAARQLREMAEARDVEISVGQQLPSLTVDVGRLELALLNLVSNGIKYSDPQKPSRFVEIAAEAADGHVHIMVRDNGIGIPASHLPTVFDRFSRAHADQDDGLKVSGLGLGLSIVSDCVRAMNGRVEVNSEESVGTTFILTLPSHPTSG